MDKNEKEETNQIYVGKLSWRVHEKDLEEAFKEFGHIKEINVKRGYAFIVLLCV